MANISKMLVASGLVLVTSPFCFTACAQDYVDVEAERGARTAPASPATAAPEDESGSEPQRPAYSQPSYSQDVPTDAPATSYSLGGSVAAPATSTTPPPISPQSSQVAGDAVGGMGALFNEVQQLRQEVMRLNGRVEEQANEIRVLKEQSLERYRDLDQRLGGGSGGSPSAAAGSPVSAAGATAAMGTGKEIPGEADAYRAAYAQVRNQEFKPAVDSFNQFLRQYPDGKYAANAHYWLGELYLVIDPPDPESSRQAFSLLLSEYPDNPKAPDAMFKLGKVYFLKGNRSRSREYMDRVINEYGNSNSSAVQMARDFIAQNF